MKILVLLRSLSVRWSDASRLQKKGCDFSNVYLKSTKFFVVAELRFFGTNDRNVEMDGQVI